MIREQYWRLIWDRANDTEKRQYTINVYTNSEDLNRIVSDRTKKQCTSNTYANLQDLNKIFADQTKSNKQFLIEGDNKMKFKGLLNKAQELTKEKVEEISFQESDVSTIIVYNDQSFDYVKRHAPTDSEFTLTIHTKGVATSTTLKIIGEMLAALFFIFMITVFVTVVASFYKQGICRVYFDMFVYAWMNILGLDK